ncbi:MAG: folate-binding protein, partial [Halieaceae bacterium]|nr:folate-binding protein [Halieaceae bacterium]
MTTYLARLSHRGALEFEGPDSRQFLQGQTTCDLEQLSAERSLVGAFCNPQGRMVCDFRLLQQDSERLLMVLERDCLEIARDTFAKYIVFSKAELREADAWCHYALWGEDA